MICRTLDHLVTFFGYSKPTFGYRPSRWTIVLNTSGAASRFFRKIWDKELLSKQELLYAIFVNSECQPILWRRIHVGGTNQTIVDFKLIISLAENCKASGVLLAHNHPSGNCKPSQIDRDLTDKFRMICDACDITFHDHIILTQKEADYFSFVEHDLL